MIYKKLNYNTMGNILDVMVSTYKNKEDTAPKTAKLCDVLADKKYKHLVEKIRATTDETEQKKLKLKLPCCTPSCVTEEDGQITHTGIICQDIDFKDNTSVTNFSDFKKLISKIESVAYCSLSASGKGYFALIPISNPAKHLEHFLSLELDFARCGITIDPACKNVNRLRFATYDAEPYINLNAKPYNFVYNPVLTVNDSYPDSPCIDRVEALILEIEDRIIDITGNYPQWFQIGCALANEFGEFGREFFHKVSQYSDLYDADYTDKQFTEYLKSQKDPESKKIHINTLFFYAKQYGIVLSGPEIDFKN